MASNAEKESNNIQPQGIDGVKSKIPIVKSLFKNKKKGTDNLVCSTPVQYAKKHLFDDVNQMVSPIRNPSSSENNSPQIIASDENKINENNEIVETKNKEKNSNDNEIEAQSKYIVPLIYKLPVLDMMLCESDDNIFGITKIDPKSKRNSKKKIQIFSSSIDEKLPSDDMITDENDGKMQLEKRNSKQNNNKSKNLRSTKTKQEKSINNKEELISTNENINKCDMVLASSKKLKKVLNGNTKNSMKSKKKLAKNDIEENQPMETPEKNTNLLILDVSNGPQATIVVHNAKLQNKSVNLKKNKRKPVISNDLNEINVCGSPKTRSSRKINSNYQISEFAEPVTKKKKILNKTQNKKVENGQSPKEFLKDAESEKKNNREPVTKKKKILNKTKNKKVENNQSPKEFLKDAESEMKNNCETVTKKNKILNKTQNKKVEIGQSPKEFLKNAESEMINNCEVRRSSRKRIPSSKYWVMQYNLKNNERNTSFVENLKQKQDKIIPVEKLNKKNSTKPVKVLQNYKKSEPRKLTIARIRKSLTLTKIKSQTPKKRPKAAKDEKNDDSYSTEEEDDIPCDTLLHNDAPVELPKGQKRKEVNSIEKNNQKKVKVQDDQAYSFKEMALLNEPCHSRSASLADVQINGRRSLLECFGTFPRQLNKNMCNNDIHVGISISNDFITTGVLEIMPSGRKKYEYPKKVDLLFIVLEGIGEIGIGNSSRVMRMGHNFYVPKQTLYYIYNISTTDKLLLYFCKIIK